MTFKVTYNARNHTWENGKYTDNDNYTISFDNVKMNRNEKDLLDISTRTIKVTVNEDELNELWLEIKKAVAERNDFRGYHE